MERPFYEADEDRINLVPSLQQDAPWVQVPAASAGVDSPYSNPPYGSALATGFGHGWTKQPGRPHLTSNSSLAYGAYYNASAAYGAITTAYGAASTAYGADSMAYDAIHATYDATNTAYGDASVAYGTASTAYGDINAAYAADTDTSDLTRGIWPSTDPVSTSMGYDYDVADINPTVYSSVPNPTVAPSTTTPVSSEPKSAVASADGSRPQCATCNTTFKRASDLVRHQKKHQARRAFKCSVPGCNFKGSYRKDKLDAHIKSCHLRGAA